MSLKSTKTWLTTFLLVLVTSASALGQGMEDMAFFAPPSDGTFGGGRRPREGFFFSAEWLRMSISAPEKTLIGFETDAPTAVYTSFSDSHDPRNDLDTGFLNAKFVSGMRYEFGDIYKHHGWFFSGYYMHEQGQVFETESGAEMIIDDPTSFGTIASDVPGGIVGGNLDAGDNYGRTWGVFSRDNGGVTELRLVPMPVFFEEVKLRQKVRTWSVEMNYLYRAHPTYNGAIFEFFGGVRYMEFNDKFQFEGRGSPFTGVTTTYPDPADLADPDADPADQAISYEGTPTGPRTIFHDTYWRTCADNHIVGPQLGVRWSKAGRRWTLFSEGRFFAGFNRQNISQDGYLGSEIGTEAYETLAGDVAIDDVSGVAIDPAIPQWVPYGVNGPLAFNHSRHADEWAPGVELRLGANWQFTDIISMQATYNMVWIDGIARSANMTTYSFDGDIMGIAMEENRQDLFMNSFGLGVTFNR